MVFGICKNNEEELKVLEQIGNKGILMKSILKLNRVKGSCLL